MCCILEIGLFILGITALTSGKLKLSSDKVVDGTTGRLLGLVAMIPFPLALLMGLGLFAYTVSKAGQPNQEDPLPVVITVVEVVVDLTVALVVFGTTLVMGKPENVYPNPYSTQYPNPYGNAPPMPPSNNPYQTPNQGPFDPFRQ